MRCYRTEEYTNVRVPVTHKSCPDVTTFVTKAPSHLSRHKHTCTAVYSLSDILLLRLPIITLIITTTILILVFTVLLKTFSDCIMALSAFQIVSLPCTGISPLLALMLSSHPASPHHQGSLHRVTSSPRLT